MSCCVDVCVDISVRYIEVSIQRLNGNARHGAAKRPGSRARGPYGPWCGPGARPVGHRTPVHCATVRRHTDYALARRAVLRDLHAGRVTRLDVCDAHPELVRAARYVGEKLSHACPVCGGSGLAHVSYVYGEGLRAANGRCISHPGELEKLGETHDEFACYLVEVCPDCGWNHLARRELHGRRHDHPARRASAGGRT